MEKLYQIFGLQMTLHCSLKYGWSCFEDTEKYLLKTKH